MSLWNPPSWWTTERTEDMSESDISIKRDYSQPYDVQPEKKSPEDTKMIEKAYAKAKLCKLCDGLDWTRGPQRITVWTLFVSAERDGCAGCLVLYGILATHASFSDALERSAWRLWPETLLFSMHNGLLRISKRRCSRAIRCSQYSTPSLLICTPADCCQARRTIGRYLPSSMQRSYARIQAPFTLSHASWLGCRIAAICTRHARCSIRDYPLA
jgi:hypothetical protein